MCFVFQMGGKEDKKFGRTEMRGTAAVDDDEDEEMLVRGAYEKV